MFLSRQARRIRKVLGQLAKGFRSEHARYISQEVLGVGGFGDVERCFDQRLNRLVARKILRTSKDGVEPNLVSLLLNEARLVCYIDHPGVVPIYDIFVNKEGQFSYTMKVLEGSGLEEMLFTFGTWSEPFPLSQTLQIFTKVCETMAYAHDKGVLHLDLKPSNIMVGRFGEVMVLDWGSARLFEPVRYEAFLKASGVPLEGNEIKDLIKGALGSVPHMPLEQMTQPRELLTPAADIFSAGVLLYYMLCGTYPFQGETIQDYAMALCHKPKDLREIRSDLPVQLSDICMKMLKSDPEARYQSFLEVLADLQELANAGRSFQLQTFEAGEILMQEGEIGDFALYIVEGEVEISVNVEGKQKVLATCTKGEIIGEVAIFSHQPRMATVTALTTTVTRVMTRDDIETELDKLPPWVSQMIRGLSNKFIARQKNMS